MVASLEAAIFNCQCDQMQNCVVGCETIYKFSHFIHHRFQTYTRSTLCLDVYRSKSRQCYIQRNPQILAVTLLLSGYRSVPRGRQQVHADLQPRLPHPAARALERMSPVVRPNDAGLPARQLAGTRRTQGESNIDHIIGPGSKCSFKIRSCYMYLEQRWR